MKPSYDATVGIHWNLWLLTPEDMTDLNILPGQKKMTLQDVHLRVPKPKRTQACRGSGCKCAEACIAMESKCVQAYTQASHHRSGWAHFGATLARAG